MTDPIRPLTELEKLQDEALNLLAGNPAKPHMVNWAPIRRTLKRKVQKLMTEMPQVEAMKQIVKELSK